MRYVVDGENSILGRLASEVARKLMEGHEVYVVNAKKIIIVGNPPTIVEKYKKRIDGKIKGNPLKGPKFPRTIEGIVKRAIRGMIPRRKPKGREALRRLRVYRDVPDFISKDEIIKVDSAVKSPLIRYLTVEELSKRLGGK